MMNTKPASYNTKTVGVGLRDYFAAAAWGMSRQCPQYATDEQSEEYRKQLEGFLKYQNLDRDEVVISRELLEETILTLEHARKFITSRWIAMHPSGVELYDECIQKLKEEV